MKVNITSWSSIKFSSKSAAESSSRILDNNSYINYKNLKLLRKFISDSYRIVPRKYAKIKAKQQKHVVSAIKIARFMGLIPYVEHHYCSYKKMKNESNIS